MKRAPALQSRIEKTKHIDADGNTYFEPEQERIRNVMLKLARGHAAFELSQFCRAEPYHYWCTPLEALTEKELEDFGAAHIQRLFGETGTRNMQRMYVAEIKLESKAGENHTQRVIVNDWVEVQETRYRFLSIEDSGSIIVPIMISDYLACEVAWEVAWEAYA